jgi:hypothetical protein
MKRTILLIALIATAAQAAPVGSLQRVGTMSHPPLAEVSGIDGSRTYPGVFWVLNDSGDSARLFAVDGEGRAILPPWAAEEYWVEKPEEGREEWPGVEVLGAANVDWEDICVADGKIYIAETGNNFNARRDLGVYVLNEPNPMETRRARILAFLPVRYPDQEGYPGEKWDFDCESLFVAGGKLHFLTKHRAPGKKAMGQLGTKLYRLDTAFTDRENVLTLVESRGDLALPTAAALSPDGTKLAVLTLRALRVFGKPAEGEGWLTGPERRLFVHPDVVGQAEAVCWDDDATLRIASEDRSVFTVKLADVPPAEENPMPLPPDEVPVGAGPGPIVPLADGRMLAVVCMEGNTVSLIRLIDRREIHRVRLPVGRVDEDRAPLSGFLSAAAGTPDGKTLYVTSTSGQIFRIDVETGESETLFDNPRFDLDCLEWDAPRQRLLVAGDLRGGTEDTGWLWTLRDGELVEVLTDIRGIYSLCRVGDTLWIAAGDNAICGDGEWVCDLIRFDLAKSEMVDEHGLPEGCLTDLAPDGSGGFFAADNGKERILHFDPEGRRPSIRYTGNFWRNDAGDCFDDFEMAVDGPRFVTADSGDQGRRVYEYRIVAGVLSDVPLREYALPAPGIVGGLAAVLQRYIAVSLCHRNTVRIYTPEDARPFSGFDRRAIEGDGGDKGD